MSDVVSTLQHGLIFLNGFSGFVNVIGWDVFPLAFRFEVFIRDFLCSSLNKNLINHMLYPLLLCAYLQFLISTVLGYAVQVEHIPYLVLSGSSIHLR